MVNKVYKGRKKLSLEQASSYYIHAYKIGVEHGHFEERNRIMEVLLSEMGIGVEIEDVRIRDAIIRVLMNQIKDDHK